MSGTIKNIIGAIVAVFMLFALCHSFLNWSTPSETQKAIDDALDEARDAGLLFDSQAQLDMYAHGEYGRGYDVGYEDGNTESHDLAYSDGYAEGYGYGYGDGYYDGYEDCAAGVPYEDQGPPI